MCNTCAPMDVLHFLDMYFELVDKVAEENGVTKAGGARIGSCLPRHPPRLLTRMY